MSDRPAPKPGSLFNTGRAVGGIDSSWATAHGIGVRGWVLTDASNPDEVVIEIDGQDLIIVRESDLLGVVE